MVAVTLRSGVILLVALIAMRGVFAAMTMKQLIQTLDMMRGVCSPKFPNLSKENLEGLRKGIFVEGDKDLKCYTLCIAQMAGTVTKKKEISLEKTIGQLEMMLPADMKTMAIEAVKACAQVQYEYKDMCDKVFYATKCARDKQPDDFLFP